MKAATNLALLLVLAAPPGAAARAESSRTAAREILEQVLVKVNGDIITKTELEQRQIAELRRRMNQQVDADALKTDEQLKKALAEITPQILVDTIDELLMVQMGKDKGYQLKDEQFREWLEKMRKDQNLEDEAKFQMALKQESMTIADLRKNVERQFMIGQVQREEVGAKLQITEEEARQYYLAHKSEFAEPATVTLREILLEVPTATKGGQAGVNVAQDDETAQKAAAVRARVVGGEDFAKVAAEVSASPSKANGGLVGPINQSELSAQLQQLLLKMKPGDITEPLRTARGFQILKLESTKPTTTPAFDSVRDVVADRVHEVRQQTEVRKFLARVRSEAIIEWKNDELKKAYEKALAAPEATGGI